MYYADTLYITKKECDKMTDNELLLAISDMMDRKLKRIEIRMKRIEVDLIKEKILP